MAARWGVLSALLAVAMLFAASLPISQGSSPAPTSPQSGDASPSVSASPIPSGSAVESSPSPAPSLGTACTLSAPTELALPDELALNHGFIRAPLGDGKFLVGQFRTWVPDPKFPQRERARELYSIWNRDSGTIERLIDVQEPVGDGGYGQIVAVAVSPDWVVWTQQLEHGMTSVLNRRTGDVRSLHPALGERPWDYTGDLSLIGDTAVWYSAFRSASHTIHYETYAADLKTGDVRKLAVDTEFAGLISPTEIATSQRIGSNGHAPLSRPAIVDIRTGAVEPDPWVEPAVVRGLAAGGAGTIEERELRESTAENSESLADIVLRDRDGVIRTFGPYTNLGAVTAGDRVFTWQDQQHVWALPSGQTEPILLADAGEEGSAYATVHGPWLLIHSVLMAPDGNSYTSHQQLYRTDCSGRSSGQSPAPSPSVSPSVTPLPSESPSGYVPLTLTSQPSVVALPDQWSARFLDVDGPLAVLAESGAPKATDGRSVALVDFATGTMRYLPAAPFGWRVWEPRISDGRVAWIELHYERHQGGVHVGQVDLGPLDWTIRLYDIASDTTTVVASGIQPDVAGGQAWPPYLTFDGDTVAYAIVDPSGSGDRWKIVLANTESSAPMRILQADGHVYGLEMSGSTIAWSERQEDLKTGEALGDAKLMLVDGAADARVVAINPVDAFEFSLGGGLLAWRQPATATTGKLRMSAAAAPDFSPQPIGPESSAQEEGQVFPAADGDLVSWTSLRSGDGTSSGEDADHLCLWPASNGVAYEITDEPGASQSAIGGGWIAWMTDGDDMVGLKAMPIDQLPISH